MKKWLIKFGIPILTALAGATIWEIYFGYLSVSRVEPHPTHMVLYVGDSRTPRINLLSPKNRNLSYTEKIIWDNDNSGFVAVNEEGIITALRPGPTFVTYKLRGVSGHIPIEIIDRTNNDAEETYLYKQNNLSPFKLSTKHAQIGIYPQTVKQSKCSLILQDLILNATIDISPRKTQRKHTVVRFFKKKVRVVKAVNRICKTLIELGINAKPEHFDELDWWDRIRTDDELIEIWFGSED